MLDKNDLQAIAELITASEERMTAAIERKKSESEIRMERLEEEIDLLKRAFRVVGQFVEELKKDAIEAAEKETV